MIGRNTHIEQTLRLGIEAHKRGDLIEAQRLYGKILETQADHPDANHNMGVLISSLKGVEAAIPFFQKAIQTRPKIVRFWLTYVTALAGAGNFKLAQTALKEAQNIGLERNSIHDLQKIVQRNLKTPEDTINKLRELKKTGQMLPAFQEGSISLQQYPLCPQILGIMIELATELGYVELKVELIKKRCILFPSDSASLFEMGTHKEDGLKYREAFNFFQRTLVAQPNLLRAYYKITCIRQFTPTLYLCLPQDLLYQKTQKYLEFAEAKIAELEKNNDYLGAIFLLYETLELESSDHHRRNQIAKKLDTLIKDCILFMHTQNKDGIGFVNYSRTIEKLFIITLDRKILFRPKELAAPILRLIKLHPSLEQPLSEIRTTGQITNTNNAVTALSEIKLLSKIMRLCPIIDLELEAILIIIRRYFLDQADTARLWSCHSDFFRSLIIQCAVNEYIWPTSQKEESVIDSILATIEGARGKKYTCLDFRFHKLALYQSIHQIIPTKSPAVFPEDTTLQNVFVSEPHYENLLKSKILSLHPADPQEANEVRRQYEENPYPRWLQTGLVLRSRSLRELFNEVGLKLDWESLPETTAPKILVAGCGTGQHAINTACRFTNCHVTAIDLSLASLAYAKRKTEELGITNIEYVQADIMKLPRTFGQFDVVESAGVVHHLPIPLEGLRILTDLLKPGGLFFLGLYSRVGRKPVIDAKQTLKAMDHPQTPSEMRLVRETLIANSSPQIETLKSWVDFYCMSEFRDLLFHPIEHQYDLIEIEHALMKNGLRFAGFEGRTRFLLQEFRNLYPAEGDICDLSKWHSFEEQAPSAFSGMYQFWAQKQK